MGSGEAMVVPPSLPEAGRRTSAMSSANPPRSTRQPFSGYHNRPAPFAPSPLAETGPGTPGGEYLRRYWHPIMLQSELQELPIALRILAEDLVIFRDHSGDIGLL